MSEPAPADPEILPPGRLVGFARGADGAFELTIDGAVALSLNEDESRWLQCRIEAELGSAWARTRRSAR